MDNGNDDAEHVPEEPYNQSQQPQPRPQHAYDQHGEAYRLHREEIQAMKEELAKEKREIKDEFERKERELKGELAERVNDIKAEMANNRKEMVEREKELKDEMAEKKKTMKDELKKKDEELKQLRDEVAASRTYWTVSLILFVILIASVGVIVNRHAHWELNSAVQRNLELTSTVLTLKEHKGACGTEQLDELKECRKKLQELTEIKGKCIVFEENLHEKENRSLALVKHTEFLIKQIEEFMYQSAKNIEKKDECDKNLLHVQSELSKIIKNLTSLSNEREELRTKYQTCTAELAKIQQNVR